MNQATIFNLSPRKNKTSNMLANTCNNYLLSFGISAKLFHLYDTLDNIDSLLAAIDKSHTIIFCGPSYINHYPADTMYLLEEIYKNQEVLHNQNVYGIIQGGMPYVHTHQSGVKTLELFCEEINISYKGSFVMGMGAMLDGQPLDKLLNGKKVKKNFQVFMENIRKGEFSSDFLYQSCQFKIPRILCKFLAKNMNQSIDKNIKKNGFNPLQASPYWNLRK